MLVKFTVNPSYATSAQGTDGVNFQFRAMNFLNCVYAIATAAAGSTPVVYPYTTSNTQDQTKNCILEVTSNTEAGGWQVTTAANQLSNSVLTATTSTTYCVDLMQPTGKAVFTRNRVYFGLPGSQSTMTGSSYYSMSFEAGASKATFENTAMPSIAAANKQAVHPWTAYSGNGSVNAGSVFGGISDANNQLFTQYFANDVENIYYMACTANYLIITNRNSIFYYGIRDSQYWESSITDSRNFITFGYTNRSNPGAYCTSSSNVNGQFFMSGYPTINMTTSVGTFYTCTSWRLQGGLATTPSPFSGQTASPSYGRQTAQGLNGASTNTTLGSYMPLFSPGSDMQTNANGYWCYDQNVGLSQDPTTQVWSVIAEPIILGGMYDPGTAFTCPIKLPGIMKGPNVSSTMYASYLTDYTSFSFNADNWVLVRTGYGYYGAMNSNYTSILQDTFLLRKA